MAYYPQTNLTIQLTRKKNDLFRHVMVSYSWRRIDGGQKTIYLQRFLGPLSSGKDTTIHALTVADLQTKVTVTKSFDGNFLDIIDSIVCKQGKDNVLRIEY